MSFVYFQDLSAVVGKSIAAQVKMFFDASPS